jgi:uncharacterized LabA/DUF88 family protein
LIQFCNCNKSSFFAILIISSKANAIKRYSENDQLFCPLTRNYQDGQEECRRCKHVWRTAKEKMTDVNIATAIIIDAFQDKYDTAMLVSGDSDLVPPIKAVHEHFKTKRVFIAFPPKRNNSSMALVARGSLTIGRKKLVDAQLEDEIVNKNGFKLKKPLEWQ